MFAQSPALRFQNETKTGKIPVSNRPKQALIRDLVGIMFTHLVAPNELSENGGVDKTGTGQDSRPESDKSPILHARQEIDPEKRGANREYVET
jgi:hypothetical protein